MKKYKPKIIAEIGLNYIGNKKILQQYINKLAKSNVDGISLQVLKKFLQRQI